jgi:hypothetical protein
MRAPAQSSCTSAARAERHASRAGTNAMGPGEAELTFSRAGHVTVVAQRHGPRLRKGACAYRDVAGENMWMVAPTRKEAERNRESDRSPRARARVGARAMTTSLLGMTWQASLNFLCAKYDFNRRRSSLCRTQSCVRCDSWCERRLCDAAVSGAVWHERGRKSS